MSSARPRPQNYPTILLFVVGGVTCNEVRQVREVLTARKTEAQVRGELCGYTAVMFCVLIVQVLIGCTKLLTPIDTVRLVLHRKES